MRRPLSLILVLLLVLRGLLGDAMAMGWVPALAPSATANTATTAAHGAHGASMAAAEVALPCHMPMSAPVHAMHAMNTPPASAAPMAVAVHDPIAMASAAVAGAAMASADGEAGHGTSGHANHCTACGICHSSLFSAPWPATSVAPASAVRPTQGGVRFASALAAPAIKPPIS